MSVEVVFETHATSEDNEAGVATGWLPGKLSTMAERFVWHPGWEYVLS